MTPVLIALLAVAAPAANAGAGTSHGTAEVFDKGEWEVGVYAPLRRGMGNGLEVSIHPLVALLSPHLAVKKAWSTDGAWAIASRHSVMYPTPLLRTLAREGTGGIIVADAVIPPTLASDHRFIATTALGESTDLSLSARAMVGAALGESDWPSIDMPLSYTRTAAYRDGVATAAGVHVDGTLVGPLFYRVDIDGWWLPNSDATWATEVKTTVHWRPSDGFTAQAGGTAVIGEYPYGTNWHVLPSFDLIWRW